MSDLLFNNGAAPGTPAAGKTALFVDTNKRLSSIDETPTTRVFVDQTSSEVLSNKSIDDSCKLVDNLDNTKVIQPSLGGMTTGVTLTLSTTQSTSQSLAIPNIAASSIFITDTLAQPITGVKTMTNMTTAAGTTAIPSMTITSGTNLTNAVAGGVEFDGAAFYKTVNTTSGRGQDAVFQIFRTTGDGSAIGPGIADFFPATSSFATVTNGVYEITYYVWYLKTTAGTVTYTITNTQTYTNSVFHYLQSPAAGFATNATCTEAGLFGNTTAAAALPATASLTTAVNHYAEIRCLVECGTAGNIRLRVTSGAGTVTLRRGSYYTVRQLSAGNVGTFVA